MHGQSAHEDPFTEEIKAAFFSLESDKAPEPEDFLIFFYQHFWDSIKGDILKVFSDFQCSKMDLSRMNHTFISLISKKAKCMSVQDYSLISIENGVIKLISKILSW